MSPMGALPLWLNGAVAAPYAQPSLGPAERDASNRLEASSSDRWSRAPSLLGAGESGPRCRSPRLPPRRADRAED